MHGKMLSSEIALSKVSEMYQQAIHWRVSSAAGYHLLLRVYGTLQRPLPTNSPKFIAGNASYGTIPSAACEAEPPDIGYVS